VTQSPRNDPLPDNAPHILVVDDDHRIRDLLARYLYENGFRVTPAADAASARAAMRGLTFDLVILDIMMPGEDGLSLAQSLKQISTIPICMLTARSETGDRIKGLEIGVDDYVTKPFEPRELVLRLQNILRRGRSSNGTSRDEVKMGQYTFHIVRGELKRGDETIKITERERDFQDTNWPMMNRPAVSEPSMCRSIASDAKLKLILQILSTSRRFAARATFFTLIKITKNCN
jgi:two-component system, OmpR family, phosphate regulon response regulator OmpR